MSQKRLTPRLLVTIPGLIAGFFATAASAALEVNMPYGVTEISRDVWWLHMLIFWICVGIGVVVFGAMAWSIYHHRKSKGREAAQFHESTTVEIAWTVVPFVILVLMAIPAAGVLIEMEDTRDSDMTVKVTGYQWKWEYEYLDHDVQFYSSLHPDSNRARQLGSGISPGNVENYLLEVDNRMVVPVDKKVRILLTSFDVIHAWWVPELGGKKDAIPGFINEMWFKIEEPGVYRGQCAELCGRDHGFMPIVVEAVSQDEYDAWVAEQGGADSKAEAKAEAREQAVAGYGEDEVRQQPDAPAPIEEQTAAAEPAEPAADMSKDELMSKGEQVYGVQCAACHQANGEGVPAANFPALKGNAIATGDVGKHIDVVVNGVPDTGMQAFGGLLSDAELAAVITYERNAWGNNTGDLVQPKDIQAAR